VALMSTLTPLPGVTELVLEEVEDLNAVRSEWTELAERCGNVFGTWEWADAWCRHLGNCLKLSIGVLRDEHGEAVAILPLCITRELPFRLVRFIGAGPSDELGPICAPEHRPAAVAALTRQVEQLIGTSGIFLGERLPGDEHVAQQVADELGGIPVRHIASPVLPVDGRTFEDFLADRSRNFRNQVRRRMRKLERRGVVFRLTEDPATLTRDMQTLFRLHAARWSHGESTVFDGVKADFHLEFAHRALEHGWLRLWTMELDGEPVASWYGLRYGEIENYYQAGRDPAYDELHVGFVMLCHSIERAFGDRVREYRFGSGDEDYKSRFAEYDSGLETLAISRGARGRLALVALRTALRTPKRIQRVAWRVGSGNNDAR
jgi:CelD/BcsL family acetyltransferase involved in cellulose biosynthesis